MESDEQRSGALPATDSASRPCNVVLLVRHGSTPWSRTGRHTGRTDLELDEGGTAEAIALGARLANFEIRRVLTSPLARARETCRLAGFAHMAEYDADLMEWDYGAYEGQTTPQIREERPGWDLFSEGCPDGEDPEQVVARVDRVLHRLEFAPEGHGAICLFAHGHLLRVLAARHLQLGAEGGRMFALDAASISSLGFAGEHRVVRSWNT